MPGFFTTSEPSWKQSRPHEGRWESEPRIVDIRSRRACVYMSWAAAVEHSAATLLPGTASLPRVRQGAPMTPTAREREEKAIREYSAECAAYAREADGYTDAKRVHGLNLIGECKAAVVASLDALVAEVREEDATHLESKCDCNGGTFCGWCKAAAAIRARR